VQRAKSGFSVVQPLFSRFLTRQAGLPGKQLRAACRPRSMENSRFKDRRGRFACTFCYQADTVVPEIPRNFRFLSILEKPSQLRP
jgi:hypothetical protein